MTPESPRPASLLTVALYALALCAVFALVFARLSSYGIWDPWELAIADAARKLGGQTGASETPVALGTRLVSLGFAWFDVREWAGRLPIALSGSLLLVVTGLMGLRYQGARLALYAVLALGTTPFFLVNSRGMVGAAPVMLASTLVMWGATAAVFPGKKPGRPELALLWLLVAGLGAALGTWGAGALLTVVPPLLAVSLVALLRGEPARGESKLQRTVTWCVIAAGLSLALLVGRAIARHVAEPSLLIGALPVDPPVPTFERALAHLFHGFAPWSALFPLALASLLDDPPDSGALQPLKLVCLLWAALAYAAQTVFFSTYGTAPFLAPSALAIAVALWLVERERARRSYLPEAVIALLFVGLLARDYALYPSSPFSALEISDAKAPDVFNPKRAWGALFGAFGVALVLACFATDERRALDLKAPYRGLSALWRRSVTHKAWLIAGALLASWCVVFGAVAWVDPAFVHLTSLARRIGRALSFVPLALPLLVALGQLAFVASGKLARARHVPMLVAGLALGAYTSQGFLPALSEHFSPRDVFDTYNELKKPGEPLAQHRVEGSAAAYYAEGSVREIASQHELIAYLAEPGRRWAAFPSESIADLDVAFRKRTGRHLFVPSDDNARVTLVANQPVPGKQDKNPLALNVLKQAPKVAFPVGAKFDDAIELVGYDLELPGKDSVGAGQTFHVTWVWRALRGKLGSYKVFLHVDSGSQRIHGDHDPVDGKYPVRLWDEGDVILDRQAVSVPATSPPGAYSMNIGFFRGESRLKITAGDNDGGDRLRAGTVHVR